MSIPLAGGVGARRLAFVLWLLSGLFLLRVLGQAAVVLLDASSAVAIDRLAELLPPPGEWYSGLLAYPLLLPAQVVILLAMVELNRRVGGGRGLASRPRPRLGRALCVLAALYASVMLVRYGISSATHPDRRLLPPGIIPIVFHWVLAAYLATLGAVALGRPRGAG